MRLRANSSTMSMSKKATATVPLAPIALWSADSWLFHKLSIFHGGHTNSLCSMIVYSAAFSSVPGELLEAARIAGVSLWQTLLQIVYGI